MAPLIPPAEPGGREREVDMHEIFNGILYVLRSGCSWRMLPHDLPPWGTVHYYYRRFRRDGTLLKVHEHLRTKVRRGAGRHPHPSAAILDSQSVKTTKKMFSGLQVEFWAKLLTWRWRVKRSVA
jgi:putative transposase